jgi:predicted O-methyltransferase YrrM
MVRTRGSAATSPIVTPASVVNHWWQVAETEGAAAARHILWRAVARDPLLLTQRPVLGALRRLHGFAAMRDGSHRAPLPPSSPRHKEELIERFLRDRPALHMIGEAEARWLTERGMPTQPGPMSWAVPPQVIRYFAATVKPHQVTLETGAGHSTVALAILSKHHTCITIDEYSVEATRRYLKELGITSDKVTFIVESSDTALPKLSLSEKLDFAYIDGEHGYPFPALDWHYVDRQLKIGGIIGFDNAEIPSVNNHCQFMEENKTYKLVQNISGPELGHYAAYFYAKLVDQTRGAGAQLYNHRRVPGLFPQDKAPWPWA